MCVPIESWKVKFIADHSNKMCRKDIQMKTGLSRSTVIRYEKRLGIKYQGMVNNEMKQFIKDNYHRMTYDEMGDKLELNRVSVYKIAKRMGLGKKTRVIR